MFSTSANNSALLDKKVMYNPEIKYNLFWWETTNTQVHISTEYAVLT